MSKMDNNRVKRIHCERKMIFDCILNNALFLIVNSFIRENIHYVFRFPFVSPCSIFFPVRTQRVVRLHVLARIPIHFIRDIVYYLHRFAWRTRASMFHALRFCLRSRAFQRRVLFPTHARARNPRHLHRDARAAGTPPTWLQIVQVSSTTNQVLWTARLSRNPDVCVHAWSSSPMLSMFLLHFDPWAIEWITHCIRCLFSFLLIQNFVDVNISFLFILRIST